MGFLRQLSDRLSGGANPAATPSVFPAIVEVYDGLLSVAVAEEWIADAAPGLGAALAGVGVERAVAVAVGQFRRDASGEPTLATALRIVRTGGPTSIGSVISTMIEATRAHGGAGAYDTIHLVGDHPIFHDPEHSIPLVPAHLELPVQPRPPVDRTTFAPLAESGIRNTYAYLWKAVNEEPSLGCLSLGVRRGGTTYTLLAEGGPVGADLFQRAAAAVAYDRRVHEFAIRPVAASDPILDDVEAVLPLRRDRDAPRSPAILVGDALPLASDFDPSPEETESIRSVLRAAGVAHGALAYVRSRLLLEVEDRVLSRHPVQMVSTSRRIFEKEELLVMLVDETRPGWVADFGRQNRVEAMLHDTLAHRGYTVGTTTTADPLLTAPGLSRVLY